MNEALDLWIKLQEGSVLDSDKHIQSIQAALNVAERKLQSENTELIVEISNLKKTIHILKLFLYKNVRCPSCGVENMETHLSSCRLKDHLTFKTWRYKT